MTPAGRDLAAEVAFRLVTGESFEGLDVGTHDGRVDLRGFSLPPPSIIGRVMVGGAAAAVLDGVISLRAVRWEGLDLSFSVLPHLRFFDATILDCVIEGARCLDWKFWRCDVARTTFTGTDLRDSVIGSLDRHNTWTGVSFDRADLRGAVMRTAEFKDCSFIDSKLTGVHFEGCVFESVRFGGVMKDLLFDNRGIPGQRPDPGPMRSVDFSRSTLVQVDFRGCRFEHVAFPDEPGLMVYPNFPPVARRQLALIDGDTSAKATQLRAVLENFLRLPGREDADGVFSRQDWVRWGVDGAAQFAEATLLRALEASAEEPALKPRRFPWSRGA